MSKEIYISTTPHETRLAIVENDALAEIYYERENEYTLAGSIYNGRVTRVLPGMQSSFVDIGLERDAFLYITDFMEEAGDSADFDSAGSGEGRAERGGRKEGRGDRTPRRDNEGGEPEAQDAAPRADGDRPERSERGDRGDRGGRGRNGRRDGRGPREDRGPRNGGESRSVNEDRPVEQPRAASTEEDFAPAELNEASGELGEGAPGADGSRRWRGRRGRRRGRGNGEAGQGANTQPLESAPDVEAVPSQAEAVQETPREPRREGRDRDSRGGRGDRGGRDHRSDRSGRPEGDRQGRHESVRERFAPRIARGGSEESGEVDLQASAEPFILPGESLSKYRRNADGTPEQVSSSTATPSNVTVVTAKPTTLVEVEAPLNWDGGSVLPGETLSRHRDRGASNSDSRREGRDQGRGNREGRGNRDSRDSGPPRQTLHPSEAVQPAVTSQHEPEALELPHPASAPAFELDPMPAHFEAEAAEHATPVSEPAEYEPAEDTAVSFRVDPVPPSEFRQAAPVVEQPEPAPVPETQSLPEPTFHAAEADAFGEAPASAVEFTSIQRTGEMLSAPVEPVSHAAFSTEAHVDAPIEHEEAIQSVTMAEAEVESVVPAGSSVHAAAPQHFAPGDGQLEEELLDDEDGELPALQASSAFDDMEEETLEGTADLGTMIREMSIDQMTRPADPLDEDEDDFDIDEEDLEEDEFDNVEGSSEEGTEDEEFADAEHSGDIELGEEADGDAAALRDSRPTTAGEEVQTGDRRPRREGGRRSGRDRNSRDRRPSGGRSSHSGGGSGGGRSSRHSAQTTNLPAISDLLKPGQELLVQIAKEPIAKKGARITSHIALPGRFLVFMPTVNHVGVSRKIESDGERRRLKEILLSEKGDASGGFIVRTAAANASEDELRSDLRFLLNLWADIKSRSESSKSPALIYHDLNLVERILRDQVTDNFSAIWVDTEDAYERVLRFLQRFQPSLIRRVKLYTKDTPLFEQFGITEEINKALRSKVWLKSGGSIVINQTEALVAIDINTGKYVGKTARLEDTIVKTNLDAIPEIVRQIRLRDLGGIIIIDFIDMDERKNRHKVMAALEEELKSDRAPSKVLQFNDFGLVAITRKRVKQSLERTLSTTCGVCQGTGMVKSPVTICNDIYIEMKKMQKLLDRGDVMLRVNPEVVKQLKAPGAKWLHEMEEMVGKTILVKSDPSIHPEQFDIH